MTTPLPNRLPDHTDGQPGPTLSDATVAAAVEHAIEESRRNGTSPRVVIGTTPPVAQQGRPPMSQGATDASVMMLAGGATTVMVGGAVSVVMYVSQFADPVVCGLVFGAPTVFVLGLARLAKKAKGVLPDEHHHHYEAPVYQDNSQDHSQRESKTVGVWAKTNNEQ
jgi:hypothetical protein